MTITIMLVEDDDTIRTFLAKRLTRDGYRVISCIDGVEAIEKFEQGDAIGVDLVLTDVNMPNMDGIELAKWVTDHPEYWNRVPKILFMTGDPSQIYRKRELHRIPILTKPFNFTELTDAIERTLTVETGG